MSRGDGQWDEETLNIDYGNIDDGGDRDTYLAIASGSQAGEMIAVYNGLTIGRGVEADVRLTDPGMSRIHAQFFVSDQGVVSILDRGSRNGTFVNDSRVQQATLVRGDKVLVGSSVLRFGTTERVDETLEAALRDPLSMYYRRLIEAQLGVEFSYAKRHGLPLTVIMFEIDHLEGRGPVPVHDDVLRVCAQIMRSELRGEDLLGRYEDSVCFLVCRGTPPAPALAIARRLQQRVEEAEIEQCHGRPMTTSVGIATIPREGIDTPEDLLDAARQALEKCRGRTENRVEVF